VTARLETSSKTKHKLAIAGDVYGARRGFYRRDLEDRDVKFPAYKNAPGRKMKKEKRKKKKAMNHQ
jgi:hypothetical protein